MTAPDTDTAGGAALARCISCPVPQFADEYWGRAPLLTRAAELPSRFTDLIDPAAVDELASTRGLRAPFLRMAKQGDVLGDARFTRSGGAGATIADQAADDKILTLLADGSTLVLQALHRTWPPLVAFGSRLATELGHPVQVNAYVTPPQNQGFSAHYDVHDVFVLQVAGRKHWTIHEPVVTDPLESQPWQQQAAAVAARARDDAALIDTTLDPGDALYLPRGTIHAAQALGETSIHLTVGVHPLTRHHLARHLLELVGDDPQLRASLPMGVDLADPAVLAAELASTLDTVSARLATVRPADVARRVDIDLMRRTRPQAVAPLAQLAAADALTPATAIRRRGGLRLWTEDGGTEIRVVLLDRTVRLPAASLDIVKVLLDGFPHTAAELPGADPDDALPLIARLLREGVLVPA